jgi:hypothetical protein
MEERNVTERKEREKARPRKNEDRDHGNETAEGFLAAQRPSK